MAFHSQDNSVRKLISNISITVDHFWKLFTLSEQFQQNLNFWVKLLPAQRRHRTRKNRQSTLIRCVYAKLAAKSELQSDI